MREWNQDGPLEERLRRDAAEAREPASPERRARILAALESVERGPGRRPGWRPMAAAALLLVALGVWMARDVHRTVAVEPASAGLQVAAIRSEARPTGGARGMGVRVGGWANTSLCALRSRVDDPLRREVHALSIDAIQVFRSVSADMPGILGRFLDPLH